ncbi:nuclear transport factor 2 family protein [Frigoriglobus tundricola]|uniref:SnoaL-like domain-containing protein n=1 Tax=Frigoriglobus tundricola TaxID=2774151 RepID=A0A6M5YL34_9BACT|nr:nuclear transport factor 2 family protein [Frigoriglobus tundricola]QJW93996.1 hypothetical protein FTUN_1513 [Frigoriglobus tundricola]
MTGDGMRDVIGRFVAAYNRFDVNGMLALLAPNVVFENVSGGQVTASAVGAAEFRSLAEQSAKLFSEREQRITGITFRSDSALVSIAYRGVLAADIPGGPTAGSVLELTGESEYSFEEGRISRLVDRS